MIKIEWSKKAIKEILYWKQHDIKIYKKIQQLIEDIIHDPFNGLGKPEPLKHKLQGLWSRRITFYHRLVYSVENNIVTIYQCKFHYDFESIN